MFFVKNIFVILIIFSIFQTGEAGDEEDDKCVVSEFNELVNRFINLKTIQFLEEISKLPSQVPHEVFEVIKELNPQVGTQYAKLPLMVAERIKPRVITFLNDFYANLEPELNNYLKMHFSNFDKCFE